MADNTKIFQASKKLAESISNKTKNVNIEKPVQVEVINKSEDGKTVKGGINLSFENNAVDVSNLSEVNEEINRLKESLLEGLSKIDNNVDITVDTNGIIKAIKAIPEVKIPQQVDNSKEIIKELKSFSKVLDGKSFDVDLTTLTDKLLDIEETIENEFAFRSNDDRVKVELSAKQLSKMGGSQAFTGGKSGLATETKQTDIITAIEGVSGLQRATDLEGNGLETVGTTAVELTFTGKTESILITYPAIAANTGQMYIGKSTVTNLGANAVAVLLPGQSITLDYDDSTNAIYAVSDTASQTILSGAAL